jgi:hypothetical protein
MNALKHLVLIAVAGICIAVTALKMAAQVSVEVGSLLNVPMVTTTRRLMAAPNGYYGSECFTSGVFIGAGPWFHGSDNFQGQVNNRYHPEHGHKGPAFIRSWS